MGSIEVEQDVPSRILKQVRRAKDASASAAQAEHEPNTQGGASHDRYPTSTLTSATWSELRRTRPSSHSTPPSAASLRGIPLQATNKRLLEKINQALIAVTDNGLMQQKIPRGDSAELLRLSLKKCLDLADHLGLDMVAPHIDLAIVRLEEAVSDPHQQQTVAPASVTTSRANCNSTAELSNAPGAKRDGCEPQGAAPCVATSEGGGVVVTTCD